MGLIINILISLTAHSETINKYEYDTLLANCIYESASVSHEEKVAIAHVVLNRVSDKRWGQTITKVVFAPAQFSWTAETHLREPSLREKRVCHKAVQDALAGKGRHSYNHYYLASIDTPKWAKGSEGTLIDQHIFMEL